VFTLEIDRLDDMVLELNAIAILFIGFINSSGPWVLSSNP